MSATMPQDVGMIYVLANTDNTTSKVGMTRNGTPDGRADDYSSEYGIKWRVYWSAHTANVAQVEARIHKMLEPWRHDFRPGAREIFGVPPHKAKVFAEQCVVPLKTTEQLAAEQAEREQRQREAEARAHSARLAAEQEAQRARAETERQTRLAHEAQEARRVQNRKDNKRALLVIGGVLLTGGTLLAYAATTPVIPAPQPTVAVVTTTPRVATSPAVTPPPAPVIQYGIGANPFSVSCSLPSNSPLDELIARCPNDIGKERIAYIMKARQEIAAGHCEHRIRLGLHEQEVWIACQPGETPHSIHRIDGP
jgi:hypothetical protein